MQIPRPYHGIRSLGRVGTFIKVSVLLLNMEDQTKENFWGSDGSFLFF